MGKNNNRNRVNPQNIDPLSNPKTMEREALNIFISISKANYDIGYVYRMFSYPQFVQAAIRVASERYIKAEIHRQAVEYTYPNSTDRNVIEVHNADFKCSMAWKIILDILTQIQMSGDPTVIYNLHSALGVYKGYL